MLIPLVIHHTTNERHVHPLTSPSIRLHTHDWGPFLQADLRENSLNLVVFSPDDVRMNPLRLTVDVYSTLGRVALRYFPVIASWSVGVVGFVFLRAWKMWQKLGEPIHHDCFSLVIAR